MTAKEREAELMVSMLYGLVNAYNDDGNLVDEYCSNIFLPELTEEEYILFKKLTGRK